MQHTNQKKFYDMFLDQLRDVYSAEKQIIENMPKIINAASSKELKEGLKKHYQETNNQKVRLEKVFSKLGESPEGQFCEGVKGLLKEVEEIINRNDPNFVEDAGLIAAAQKIEHYEIAAYGTLVSFASHLQLDEVKSILQEILNEEGKTNKQLTKLAEGTWLTTGINAKAVNK